jgi:hypothetical protein
VWHNCFFYSFWGNETGKAAFMITEEQIWIWCDTTQVLVRLYATPFTVQFCTFLAIQGKFHQHKLRCSMIMKHFKSLCISVSQNKRNSHFCQYMVFLTGYSNAVVSALLAKMYVPFLLLKFVIISVQKQQEKMTMCSSLAIRMQDKIII